jgi:hypothetical protein
MPRKGGKRYKNKRRSRRPVNDINHNDTNITINFKKVLPLTLVPSPGNTTFRALRLAPSIAQITADLGAIYKLYRFTSVHFTFQAELNQNLVSDVALNYIPAQEAISGQPTTFEEFEGPAVGYYSNARGAPYSYRIPSKVLNAMPYNWYETKAGEASDLTQGVLYFLSNVPTQNIINIYAHFTCEFQTLEDPAFLTQMVQKANSQGEMTGQCIPRKITQDRFKPAVGNEETEDPDYDQVSIYSGTRQSCRGR